MSNPSFSANSSIIPQIFAFGLITILVGFLFRKKLYSPVERIVVLVLLLRVK